MDSTVNYPSQIYQTNFGFNNTNHDPNSSAIHTAVDRFNELHLLLRGLCTLEQWLQKCTTLAMQLNMMAKILNYFNID